MLHEVIAQLRKAVPAQSGAEPDSMDFVVNATFKVSRQQVAGALWRAFGSQITWFRAVEVIEPPTLRFRSIEHLALRMVDYPLNEGGSIGIVSIEPSSDAFRFDLKSIRRDHAVLCFRRKLTDQTAVARRVTIEHLVPNQIQSLKEVC